MLKSLSGRFLLLTIIFVMVAEVLIFVPSIARFRQDYINAHLERAQIASLALEADSMITRDLEAELLENAGVFNVVLRRDEMRQLALSGPLPGPIMATYDMRDDRAMRLISDAVKALFNPQDQVIRIIGNPVKDAGLLIEVTMPSGPMRNAMLDYGWRVFLLSAVISIFTAGLLFIAVRWMMVRPVQSIVDHMQAYAQSPEDAHQVIVPRSSSAELRQAEESLRAMQTALTASLRQKERLAQLGTAVAKISHDLRNILTAAQLFSDRMETSSDPTVQRLAPKLIRSITRAVNLCETTLTFGKAEEALPTLEPLVLTQLVSEAIETEQPAAPTGIELVNAVPPHLAVLADKDQLYRVLTNLVRNARQAMVHTNKGGTIKIDATESDRETTITVTDTGPGIPEAAQKNLFKAFAGSTTKGGSGLGLVISAELIRGHGGRLELASSDTDGTTFAIILPKQSA
ncbi:MAG: sensor histidine kinase [Planktomarina sp.]